MFAMVMVPLTRWTPSMLARCRSASAVTFVLALAVSINPVWGQDAKPAADQAASH